MENKGETYITGGRDEDYRPEIYFFTCLGGYSGEVLILEFARERCAIQSFCSKMTYEGNCFECGVNFEDCYYQLASQIE